MIRPPATPEQGPGLVQGIETNTEGVIDMLAGLVVLPKREAAAATFRTMAERVGRDMAVKQAQSLATRRSVEDCAAALKMPVLAIWGEDDKIAPIEKGKAFVERIPNAEWRPLAQCGHLPTLEKPTEVVGIVTSWLSSQWNA